MHLRKTYSEAGWSIFDEVFTSGATGMRKPNLSFFKYVMDKIGGDPSTVVCALHLNLFSF
jgi:FMN phosphatase YigB (HAD superfamily)